MFSRSKLILFIVFILFHFCRDLSSIAGIFHKRKNPGVSPGIFFTVPLFSLTFPFFPDYLGVAEFES
jgi:hypothetical protein